jgi:hypothetical protein
MYPALNYQKHQDISVEKEYLKCIHVTDCKKLLVEELITNVIEEERNGKFPAAVSALLPKDPKESFRAATHR